MYSCSSGFINTHERDKYLTFHPGQKVGREMAIRLTSPFFSDTDGLVQFTAGLEVVCSSDFSLQFFIILGNENATAIWNCSCSVSEPVKNILGWCLELGSFYQCSKTGDDSQYFIYRIFPQNTIWLCTGNLFKERTRCKNASLLPRL